MVVDVSVPVLSVPFTRRAPLNPDVKPHAVAPVVLQVSVELPFIVTLAGVAPSVSVGAALPLPEAAKLSARKVCTVLLRLPRPIPTFPAEKVESTTESSKTPSTLTVSVVPVAWPSRRKNVFVVGLGSDFVPTTVSIPLTTREI